MLLSTPHRAPFLSPVVATIPIPYCVQDSMADLAAEIIAYRSDPLNGIAPSRNSGNSAAECIGVFGYMLRCWRFFAPQMTISAARTVLTRNGRKNKALFMCIAITPKKSSTAITSNSKNSTAYIKNSNPTARPDPAGGMPDSYGSNAELVGDSLWSTKGFFDLLRQSRKDKTTGMAAMPMPVKKKTISFMTELFTTGMHPK